MSKALSLAQKVRQLKPGQSFTVKTKREQRQICAMAKTLRDGGFINFEIVTKATPEGIRVGAI